MNILKVNDNGITEIELDTVIDTKMQFNDLVIQYIAESNIVVIAYDVHPTDVLYVYSVIRKEKPVTFKCFNNGHRLEVYEPVNMELA